MSDITNIAKDNALSDAKDLAEELGRSFKDEDVTKYTREGINLLAAGYRFVETYEGDNSFVKDLQAQVKVGKGLSPKQVRGALNVMRADHLGIKRTDSRETREYNCFACEEVIVGITNLREHKRSSCPGKKGTAAKLESVPEPEAEEETPVIAVTDSTMNLDLSDLPDGRYVAPDLNNDRDNDYIFFSVRRTRKEKKRDRRYRYSKFRTGYEVVPEGTIEFKEWSSDSKRLFGEQRPGDDADGKPHVYRGEFEEHLDFVSINPEAWGRLFGQLIGRCFRCGKKLTDEFSRENGFGPECAKHINEYRPHRHAS